MKYNDNLAEIAENEVYRVNPEFTKEEFLRSTLIYLANDIRRPADVLLSNFDLVTQYERECLIVEADTEISYTCQVGFSRVEEYWDKEEKYENGTKIIKDVKKMRTVTDWKPFQGNNKSHEVAVVYNREKYCSYDLRSTFASCKKELIRAANCKMEVTYEGIERAKNACVDNCYYSVKLPGDTQKQESWNGVATISDIQGVILPEYKVEYVHNGERHKVSSPAYGKMDFITTEGGDFTNTGYKCSIEDVSRKKAKPLSILGILLLIASFILLCVAGADVPTIQLSFSWGIASLILGIALIILRFILKNVIEKKLAHHIKNEKIENLERVLSQKGLRPLSTSERTILENKHKV